MIRSRWEKNHFCFFQIYYKISGLEVNPNPISFLDDLLLLICIPSFFMFFSCSILPALTFEDSYQTGNLIANVLMVSINL